MIFDKAKLSGANFKGSKFNKATFVAADLKGVKMNADTRMIEVDFRGADLTKASIKKVQFRKCFYDSKTKFPSGFNPKKAGFIRI